MSKYKILLISIFLPFFLTSCFKGPVECIDPDNFGDQFKMTIDSKGTPIPIDKNDPSSDEYVRWDSSKYVLTGDKVVMIVENVLDSHTMSNTICGQTNFNQFNGWNPLFGDIFSMPPPAEFTTCTNSCEKKWCGGLKPMGLNKVPVSNFPSQFYMGLGLYFCASPSGVLKDENLQCLGEISGAPFSGTLIHVGDNACDNPTEAGCNTGFFSQACPAGGMVFKPTDFKVGYRPYLKIIDRYYTDNAGSYTVNFKEGVATTHLGVITQFVSLVTTLLCNATRIIYTNIVEENSFLNYIKALLVLYIIFTAIGFLIGVIQITNAEFVIRIFKIGVIMQLVATGESWAFFNKYFFSFFQNGVNELTSIVFGGASVITDPTAIDASKVHQEGCISNVAGIQMFDHFIDQTFSYETTRKILSLFFGDHITILKGLLFVPIIYILIIVILITVIKSVLIFMVSYLAISILIVLAPIFIPFTLFKLTRSFFDNWIKQMISYFIQPLIILIFAGFVITLFNAQMHNLFGYRICWKIWWTIPIVDIDIYAWLPDYNNKMACMLTPNTITQPNPEDPDGAVIDVNYPGLGSDCLQVVSGSNHDNVCDPYVCTQKRYVGYPYLNPQSEDDSDRIEELKEGTLVSTKDLLLLIVLVWVIARFSKIVPSIATTIAGADLDGFNIGAVASGMTGSMQSMAQKVALNPAYKAVTGGRNLEEDTKRLRRHIETTTNERMGMRQQEDGSWVLDENSKLGSFRKNVLTTKAPLNFASKVGGKLAKKTGLSKLGKTAEKVTGVSSLRRSLGVVKEGKGAAGEKLEKFNKKMLRKISGAAQPKLPSSSAPRPGGAGAPPQPPPGGAPPQPPPPGAPPQPPPGAPPQPPPGAPPQPPPGAPPPKPAGK